MLNIAVCDDDGCMLSRLEELVGNFFRTHCVDVKILAYQSGENLRYDLQDGFCYDLFLLDIEMPGTDGMELAKEIHDGLPAAGIIFITSHLEYAVAAYEYAVFRYISKSMLEEKLPAALEDFYKLYELERSSYYRIQVKSHVEHLPFRDILYILKEGKYAVFHLRSGRTASVRRSLSQVYGEIGQEYFYLADRGCIINLANVTGMDGEKILMPDGERITINRSGVTEFKSVLLHFWEKQI